MCRPGIERPDVVRRGHVQNAIHKDRSGLDLRGLSGFEGPGERKLVDVRRRNLRQPAMMLTRVCAVIGRPTLAWRLQECTGIQSLSKCRALERKHHQNQTRSRAQRMVSNRHLPIASWETASNTCSLLQGLQVGQDVVHGFIAVFSELHDVRLHRIVDRELHTALEPRPVPARRIS